MSMYSYKLESRFYKEYITLMQINIHWGEFVGPVDRTEVKMLATEKGRRIQSELYKYKIDLKGYLPFELFKNKQTKQWLQMEKSISPPSRQVVFYTKKLVDEFEDKYKM